MTDEVTSKICIEDVSYFYEGEMALQDVTLNVLSNAVTVVFGPAGGRQDDVAAPHQPAE